MSIFESLFQDIFSQFLRNVRAKTVFTNFLEQSLVMIILSLLKPQKKKKKKNEIVKLISLSTVMDHAHAAEKGIPN